MSGQHVCTAAHKSHGCRRPAYAPASTPCLAGLRCSQWPRGTAASRWCPRARALLACLSSLPLHCMDDAGCARATWHWLLPTPGGRCSPELRLPLQAAANDSATPLLVGGTRVTCRVLRQLHQHHLAYHGVACCAGVRCCSSYGRWRTIHRYAVAGRPRHVSSSQCRPWPAKALALGALATP